MRWLTDRLVKAPLKRLRRVPALNAIATTATRRILGVTGLHSELVIKHMHRIGIVRVPLPNGATLTMNAEGDDWVSNQVFWRGWDGYEPETSRVLFPLAARARVMLDVGAFVGLYSIMAGHANPRGRVFAFEPLPALFERLRRNVRVNALENVECVQAAAGAEDGEATFYHTPSVVLPFTSSLSRDFVDHLYEEVASIPVRVLTLDGFLKARGAEAVDLLKIDTEGTEPSVLDGMAETLRRDRPHIVCEVHPNTTTARALEQRLGPLGYRYYHLTPAGPVKRSRLVAEAASLNYLFTTLDEMQVRSL